MEQLNLFEVKSKICSKCRKIKDLSEFCKNKIFKDGLHIYCKFCKKVQDDKYRIVNHEKEIERGRIYRINNREKERKRNQIYYIKNKKSCNIRSAINYLKNRESHNERHKIYNKYNREIINYASYKYRKSEKGKKFLNSLQQKLRKYVSISITKRLKKRLLSKNGKSSWSFLPYTVDELIEHLESLFELWMNWQNYGAKSGFWTIDHIRPDSSFNYKSVEDEEFQKCWALENLQPMEFIANIKKSNKII